MNYLKYILFLYSFFWLLHDAQSQQTDRYVQKIRLAKQEIINLQKALKINAKTLDELSLKLQLRIKKINLQQEIIETKEFQLRQIQKKIDGIKFQQTQLENKRQLVLDTYVKFLQYAQKTHSLTRNMLFVFSSHSLLQAYQRMSYFSNFDIARKQKLTELETIDNELDNKIIAIKKQLTLEQNLLNNLIEEKQKLAQENLIINQQINEIKKQDTKLKQKLEHKQKEAKELDNKIKNTVNNEKLSDNDKFNSLHFEKMKGKLAWPVASTVVILDYGQHKHEVFDEIKIKNDGIDILVTTDFGVRAVYSGQVKKIVRISNHKYAVLIKHGLYYTLYNNLETVNVKENADVKINQTIGNLRHEKGRGVLQFQVWYKNEKLNPRKWLKQ